MPTRERPAPHTPAFPETTTDQSDQGEGTSAVSAVSAIREHLGAALAVLEKLSTIPTSIVSGPPSASAPTSPALSLNWCAGCRQLDVDCECVQVPATPDSARSHIRRCRATLAGDR
jgi:hypothetical protein